MEDDPGTKRIIDIPITNLLELNFRLLILKGDR